MTHSGSLLSVKQSAGLPYDYRAKKVVAVLYEKLPFEIALNVLGHMALAMGAESHRGLMGRSVLVDASGIRHAGIPRYPLIITQTSTSKLRTLIEQSRQHSAVRMIDFPEQMLSTGHDDELADSIASVEEESITYLGALLYGDTGPLNELTGKFSLWRL